MKAFGRILLLVGVPLAYIAIVGAAYWFGVEQLERFLKLPHETAALPAPLALLLVL